MDSKESRFFVPRNSGDRRSGVAMPPPYFTEEGMVMIDRRESADRRNGLGAAPQKLGAGSNVFPLDRP